jgi:hypothetical protein
MIKSARNSETIKSEISKSILRHKSRKRLFLQKRNSNSTKDLSAVDTKKEQGGNNSSQHSLIKMKRPPLSNFALLRSQSNLSLYKRDINSKEGQGLSETQKISSISGFKSPDLSYKCAKLADIKTEARASKHLDADASYMSNQNHLMTRGYVSTGNRSPGNEFSMESQVPSNIQNIKEQLYGRHNSISGTQPNYQICGERINSPNMTQCRG